MLRGVYTAANGMIAHGAAEDVVANNLANQATPGFKRSEPTLGAFPWQVVQLAGPAAARSGLGTGAMVDRTSLDWSPGELATGGPTDVAIVGDGFFQVAGPGGQPLYTRAGSFHVDRDGTLVDAFGRAVLGASGPIRLAPGDPVRIDQDGAVVSGGRVAGRLSVYTVPDGTPIEAVDGGAYRVDGTAAPVTEVKLLVGTVEASNVDPVRDMTLLLAVARSYEGSREALQAEDAAARKAIADVGRF